MLPQQLAHVAGGRAVSGAQATAQVTTAGLHILGRLHQAIASIYHPEPKLRRKKSKELERERHQEKLRRADALLDQRVKDAAVKAYPLFSAGKKLNETNDPAEAVHVAFVALDVE